MRVTAKKEARETGLAAVTQGPRGYDIKVDGKKVGVAGWARRMLGDPHDGYFYYYASDKELGIPHVNTCDSKHFKTAELARDACLGYVKGELRKQGKVK